MVKKVRVNRIFIDPQSLVCRRLGIFILGDYILKRFAAHNAQLAAVLIPGHGSPVAKTNDTLRQVVKSVKERGGYHIVQPAFLQFERPYFSEVVCLLVKQGVKKIIVHPYFLYMGSHGTKDLPFEIDTAVKKYPNLEFLLAPHLGYHEKLADVGRGEICTYLMVT
jgi:sirohydrochlorin ferrochelatase